MGIYEDQVLPRIVDVALGSKAMGKLRRRACEGLSGEVLEVGFGSGRNVPLRGNNGRFHQIRCGINTFAVMV